MRKYQIVCFLILSACQKRIIQGPAGAPGADGLNGTDGADAVLEVMNPCGAQGNYEEVLLKLNDGRIIALFDGGSNLDRLVVLPVPGTYSTTDGFSCTFSLNANGELL